MGDCRSCGGGAQAEQAVLLPRGKTLTVEWQIITCRCVLQGVRHWCCRLAQGRLHGPGCMKETRHQLPPCCFLLAQDDAKLYKNNEISNLIVGLGLGLKGEDLSNLRYGRVSRAGGAGVA